MEILGRHYQTNAAMRVRIEGERIAAIDLIETSSAADLPFIAPGLLDLQVNGYGGIWFSKAGLSVDEVIHVCEQLSAQGISRFLPTLITASHSALRDALRVLEEARRASPLVKDCVVGYHLEGPFISAEDGPRGAHPREHVRPADVDEFTRLQQAAGGRIRLLTLAADTAGAAALIQHCHQADVKTAIGHTSGTTEHVAAAVSAGATLSTHFGNGVHSQLARHPNYLWDQLAEDRLWASVIADGHHLPTSVLRCVLKCKGLGKTILTCDVSGFAGLLPGTYCEENMKVDVLQDGRLVVSGQTQFLAGSGATTGDCVAHVMNSCGLTLPEAIRLATANPARFLGMSPLELKTGNPATLCVFRMQGDSGSENRVFRPLMTYTNGRLLEV